MVSALRAWAEAVKRDVIALYLAARDARTPWAARIVAFGAAAYALSPIDLIPDFIPIIGYLDDLIILPIAIWAAIRLIPVTLLEEFRAAARTLVARPISLAGAAAIVVVWIACAAALSLWLIARWRG